MDNSGVNTKDPNIKDISDTAQELSHIAQEVYKKNFELAEKNKTLSLLRKIDEIILSAVTNTHQISQQVADTTTADMGFQAMAIYLIEKKDTICSVAVSLSPEVLDLRKNSEKEIFQKEINFFDESNVIAKSIAENKHQIIQGCSSLAPQNTTIGRDDKILQINEYIKSTLIYPLRIRQKPLGALVVGIRENGDAISQYQIDLVERLASVVGIGIDNALLYQEISEANARLKELDHLKDEFVSLASHELRTPMTAIKSYLWMALQGQGGPLNEKQTRYLQRSYNSADRLIKLVNDMLNISRIDSGRLNVHVAAVKMPGLVREVIEEIAPRLTELGLNVELDLNSEVPDVLADADKIKEVIYNLIGNSLKFTPNGGSIRVSFTRKDNMVEISIKDTGSGISREDISKLFQKFGILPGTYVANQPTFGTGLGLYICKSIIELHGGKIWADSEGKGKGAVFSFTLKAFNQEDMEKYNEKSSQSADSNIGLVHTSII